MRVEVVHWPEEGELLARLRSARRPRLVIVDDEADPPDPPDALEDWVRTTTPARDIEIRRSQLARRAALVDASGRFSDVGLFSWRGGAVALSPLETRITRALLRADGAVVPRQSLEAAGWPGRAVRRSTLDTTVARLRKRLLLVGLDLRTIRNRGYILVDRDDTESPPPPPTPSSPPAPGGEAPETRTAEKSP